MLAAYYIIFIFTLMFGVWTLSLVLELNQWALYYQTAEQE